MRTLRPKSRPLKRSFFRLHGFSRAWLLLFCFFVLAGCGGQSGPSAPQAPLTGMAGRYSAVTFLTGPDGTLEAALSELRFELSGQVEEFSEVAFVDGQAGLQDVSFLRPEGIYSLDSANGLSIPGVGGASGFSGVLAEDRRTYAGLAAGAAGSGDQFAILTQSGGQVAGTWNGGSLNSGGFPGVVQLTISFGQDGSVDGTFDFNGAVVDITGGSYVATPDGAFRGDLVGVVDGNPVSADFQGHANFERQVMIFQDNETHVVALQLSRTP